MAALQTPSRAHTILEAVRLTAIAHVPELRQLIARRPNALKLDHIFRILLTYLPEGTDPEFYIGFLKELSTLGVGGLGEDTPSFNPVPGQDLSEEEARQRVRRLRLAPLADPRLHCGESTDPLTLFLLHQAHKIDAETGSLGLVAQLLEPFVDHSEILRNWMISNLLPLLRLDYEYYPDTGSSPSLIDFENLEGRLAVQSLLTKAAQKNAQEEKFEIGRDLRGLVGPWMYGGNTRKRRKLEHGHKRSRSTPTASVAVAFEPVGESTVDEWSHVNEWILDLGIREFPQAVDAMTQWNGPKDVDYGDWGDPNQPLDQEALRESTNRYAQVGLATVYATNDASLETIIGSHRILLQSARLANLDEPPDLKRSDAPFQSGISKEYIRDSSSANLLRNALLQPQNPFTSTSPESIAFLNAILASCYKLLNFGNTKSSRSVAELILFANEDEQRVELRRTLYTLKAETMNDDVWASIRRQIIWLRNWEEQANHDTKESRGVFCKISMAGLEIELLRAMVDGRCYSLAIKIYCKKGDQPLPMAAVEDTILSAVLLSYDSASNGNRTRGGIRKASDIVAAFRSCFPRSERFVQTSALLSATHAMSFYSLTLQHGVPFQPVNIRAHNDPMALIGKILDQNPRSYTHLDDLLEIGQNLVAAGLTPSPQPDALETGVTEDLEQRVNLARRRITRMAIEAALAEDDFDTAYSYVVNRLSLADQNKTNPREPGHGSQPQDDISWRAAYAAGRYPTNNPRGSVLRRLEQRMELLSQALLLAPSPALSDILAVWQDCEREMADQIAQEAAKEEKWDDKWDGRIPGEFAMGSNPVIQKPRDPNRGAINEEAPMGLFDVARGAATALSKSAFPLRTQTGREAPPSKVPQARPLSAGSSGDVSDGSLGGTAGTGRVRKRDMVSNMVTGGLASGIGWVIGESNGVLASRLR